MVDSAARPVSSTEVHRREEHGAVDGAACQSKVRQKDWRRTSQPGRSGSAEANERACSTTRGSGTTMIQKRGGTRREMGGPRETPRTAVARANSKTKTSRSRVTGAQAETGSLLCCGGKCC